jgi:hypothetical protein
MNTIEVLLFIKEEVLPALVAIAFGVGIVTVIFMMSGPRVPV